MVKVVKAPCYPIFSFFISISGLFPQHFIVEVDWQPFSDVPSKIVAFSFRYKEQMIIHPVTMMV